MVTYNAGLISGLLLSKSSRQVVFSQFLKVDTKFCHSQDGNHSNIILNKDADGSNLPVYINLNGSDCAWTPDDKRTCTFLECSLLVSCMCAVCIKCVLLWTIFVVWWYPLQTVWTQIRPDKTPLLAYVTSTKLSWTGLYNLAWAYIYIPSFYCDFAKALATLRQCEVSSDPLMFVYAICTKLSWTGL